MKNAGARTGLNDREPSPKPVHDGLDQGANAAKARIAANAEEVLRVESESPQIRDLDAEEVQQPRGMGISLYL